MSEPGRPTVLGQITVEASAEVVRAADVAAQHEAGEHANCGHEESP
jgi:hypothetical protein